MPFQDTLNKATIRECWDLSLIQRRHSEIERPLAYFGLPGPEILDLLAWRNYLGRRTGVESPGRTRKQREQADEDIARLHTNVMDFGVSSGFELLVADIEDVIIDGFDINGTIPALNDGGAAHRARFRYDVVNLDFNSGIGYSKKDGSNKRIKALKQLFERQEGHSFLLFLTISVRDTLGNQIEEYLRESQERDRGSGWHELLDWYLNRDDKATKLKGVVPSFVQYVAEHRMFRCVSRPPIVYYGHKTQMVHFTFEFESGSGSFRAWSEQDERDVMELPILRCEQGKLLLPEQHPGFDNSRLGTSLDFLPSELRNSILAQQSTFEEAG